MNISYQQLLITLYCIYIQYITLTETSSRQDNFYKTRYENKKKNPLQHKAAGDRVSVSLLFFVSVNSQVAEGFLNPEKLVVLAYPVGSAA